jgi:dolichol-phosphate mannosyltransferase
MNASWQVPAFDSHLFGGKTARFCIGIPVLNEGERIRAQLKEMQTIDLGADVFIADGGSADGSLDDAFLSAAGVRGLLVKTGPGRLSAQLRMLLAVAMGEGYEGVITIDGNGKDGLEGLFRVRQALEQGYDLVQGSRFIQGGEQRNTPLDRKIALRFIHAPLISLGSGFHYTDTTNGLRGWSRRLLLDPRVAPFRDIFQRYELHYYLSVRAPKLGFRTVEVPARRVYPDRGATPTKIEGLSARADIFIQLLKVCLGRYDPER